MLFNLFKGETRASLENPSVNLTDPRAWGQGGVGTHTGDDINTSTALAVPAYWAGVNYISDEFASYPWLVYQRNGDQRTKVVGDKMYTLLHDAPNEHTTSYDFRKSMMTDVLTFGRACAYIERNGRGLITNFFKLDQRKLRLIQNADLSLTYVYTPLNGKPIYYAASDIIDIVWFYGPDGVSHVNPIEKMKNMLALSMASERYAAKTFQAGGLPPMKLTGAALSTGPAAERAAQDIWAALRNASDAQRPVAVIPNGMDLKEVGYDPTKNQLLELRGFQVIEIARMLGLPPPALQDYSRATYGNVEQADLNTIKHTMSHWCKRWEQQFNLKVFMGKTANRFCEFNLDGALRGDSESRFKGYQSAINSGWITPNEVRAKENLPPLPGGDELFIQSGTMPIAGLPGYDPSNSGDVEDPADPVTNPGQSVKEDDNPADQ